MIYIINHQNRFLFEDLLEDMHCMRYRVAVEQWAWDVQPPKPGYDKDQFDTDKTIYFVKVDSHRRVVGTARLNPTHLPHMLTEVFTDYCNLQAPPCDPYTYEFSRYFIDKTLLTRRDYVAVAYELLAAIAEFSLHSGIKRLSWLAYQITYHSALEVWTTRPLGTPRSHHNDKSVYVAAVSDMTEQGVEKVKAKGRITGAAAEYVTALPMTNPDFGYTVLGQHLAMTKEEVGQHYV